MGLDASVHCNCIREGKASAHPFPELLEFDETGEPTLKGGGEIDSKTWLNHDRWYRESCPHSGYLIQKHLGNIATVAHIRAFLEDQPPSSFPVLSGRLVFSGTHTGDWLAAREVPQLLGETKMLPTLTSDPVILQFANDMIALADASIATGNPIVF